MHPFPAVSLLLSILLSACMGSVDSAEVADLAITHASVIDPATGQVHSDRTVLIRGNRIVSVQSSESETGALRVLDATGKFLIPGLWDMHVHAARDGRARHFWPLFLAHGVTGIREMGSYLDSLQFWRQEAARAESGAPRIVWSSAMLDGVPTSWVYGYEVADSASARVAVDSMSGLGFDFLKIYDRLSREAYLGVAAQARRRGIPFAGHVPTAVSVAEASDAGQTTIEHGPDYLSCLPGGATALSFYLEADSLGVSGLSGSGFLSRLREAARVVPDPGACSDLLQRLSVNGTFLTPTLAVYYGWYAPDSLATDARIRSVPKELADRWQDGRSATTEDAEYRRLLHEVAQRLVGLAHAAGIKLLAGTDVSDEPYIFAGSSLHDELDLLVRAGLSPLDALRTATLNPALALNATDSLGTIGPGKLADLVLLDANPLVDIRNVRRVHAVVAAGRLIDAEERARLLRLAEDAAARAPVSTSAWR